MKALLCALGFSLAACGASPEEPGALVPPTADQDAALPALDVYVAGHTRRLHLETYGDPTRPPLFAFHGGGGNDFRLLLPLRELADEYFVVLWDSRGCGLSERITSEEVSWDSYMEEVVAVKAALSPQRPIHLAGYSWGGYQAARFATVHPEAVASLILFEPGPLTRQADDALEKPKFGLADDFVNEHLWQVDFLSPSDHAAMDRKAYALARQAMASFWCDPENPGWYAMWRHGIYVDILSAELLAKADAFNFAPALADLNQPVLIFGSSCGPLRTDYQKRHAVGLFQHADVVELEGVSHMDLFVPKLVSELRTWLKGHAP
ncbi:MAG: alpha/beta fold hydrolase [Myxococcota bacterium]